MPSDNVEGRRAPRQMVRPQDRTVGGMAAARRRLLARGGAAWRWAWSQMPPSTAAARIRLAMLARRVLGTPPPPPRAYPLDPVSAGPWMAVHATPTAADRTAIRAHIAHLPEQPRIVLRLDARGAAPARVAATIGSLTAQLYGHWELLVLGTASGPMDRRVRLVGDAADLAWAEVAGDWVMPLSPGDRLQEAALYRIAAEAVAHPALAIIYGDEIRPHATLPGAHPWFKPAFDLDRLLGCDLFGHAAAFRPALLDRDAKAEMARGQCLAAGLRAALAAGPGRIGHLPALLTEQPAGAPPPDAADAVTSILAAQGIAAEVRPLPPAGAGWHRVVWPVPAVPPLVSVIVPTRDRATLVAACAEGVLTRTDYPAIEFIVVDNGSEQAETRALFSRLAQDPRVRILPAPGPFNYSTLNNRAAAEARGDILLLLNNDIEVISAGWLRELVSHAVRPDVGAVGAKLLYADHTLQHGGVVTGVGGGADHYRLGVARDDAGYFGSLATVREVAAATGACLALRRSVFEAVGGLDEANLAVAFNDVDLCLRIRASGWRILWTPFAELYHLESASRGQDVTAEKARRFAAELGFLRRRWGETLKRDPFYNPNLELDGAADALAAVPRHRAPWEPFLRKMPGQSFLGR